MALSEPHGKSKQILFFWPWAHYMGMLWPYCALVSYCHFRYTHNGYFDIAALDTSAIGH